MHKHQDVFERILLVIAMIVIVGMTGCKKNDMSTNPTGGGTPAAQNTVTMQNIAFVPASITVTAGTTVTWTNKEDMTHTVTSGVPGAPDGKFNSGNLTNGQTFQFTFANKGTYPYYCIVHAATMKATVTVQ